MHYTVAVLVSNILNILIKFKTTGILVFKNSDNRLFPRFVIFNVIVYLASVSGLKILKTLGVGDYVGGALMTLPLAILGFFLNKHYVFGTGKKKQDPAAKQQKPVNSG